MTLELDKKQYENLLKLVSLGNAMANSYREETIEEFQGIFDLLYSKAEEAGLGEIVEKDEEGSFFPTEDFELMKEAVADYVKKIQDDPRSSKFVNLYHRLGRLS